MDDSSNEWIWTLLYAVAVGINVLVIVDQLTDGQLSREVSIRMRYAATTVKERWQARTQFRRDFGQAMWQAINTLEGE